MEIEDTMSVWRYYVRKTKRIFTKERTSWYDFIFGSTKMERREAQLQEWEQREIFQQLDDVLVSFNYLNQAYS